jgi:hypothetical protein
MFVMLQRQIDSVVIADGTGFWQKNPATVPAVKLLRQIYGNLSFAPVLVALKPHAIVARPMLTRLIRVFLLCVSWGRR